MKEGGNMKNITKKLVAFGLCTLLSISMNVEVYADVLDDINNTELQANVKKELKELAQNFIVYNQSTY